MPAFYRHLTARLRVAALACISLAAMSAGHAQTWPAKPIRAMLWLASDAASHVTGAAVPMDGGYTAA